jgi:hypothetical protein
MIAPGVHALTKQPRVIAECDVSGCDTSMYLQQELGVVSAGESLRVLGWEVGIYGTPGNLGQVTARCPTHAEVTEKCRHATIVTLDRVAVCQRCGRRPGETRGEAA